jgi:hypothetical protein
MISKDRCLFFMKFKRIERIANHFFKDCLQAVFPVNMP